MKRNQLVIFLIFLTTSSFAQINPNNSALIDSLNFYLEVNEERLDLLKKISFDLRLDNPDSAIYYASIGLDEAKDLDKPHYVGGFYQRTGIAHRMKGDYLAAIEMYKKAEDAYLSINAEDGLAGIYNSLGILFSITKNYPLAIEYFQKLIEIDLKQKYYPGLVLTYGNLAGIYTEKKEIAMAESYYQKALDIHDEFNISTNRVTLWNNIGNLQLLKKDLDSALSCYQKSLAYNESRDTKSTMHSLLGIGQALKERDPKAAEQPLLEANKIANSSGDRRVKADINLALSSAFRYQSDFEKAYEHMSIYSSLRDSLVSSELLEQINELEIKYETEKKELQIASEKRKAYFNKIIIYVVSSTLLIIIILIISRLFAQRKINRISKEKLETEVDYKNRLLASRTLDLNNFATLLTNLENKIADPKKDSADSLRNSLRKTIKNNLRDINDWQQMKIHFEEVHPRFFGRLNQIEPPLTPNEQKHCAYIKMKIGNKDIARMLNVNLASVHVVHHRLKKKLGLTEEESLTNYIENV